MFEDIIDTIIKIIPGAVVTTVGGVLTAVLPGKIKIVGIAPIGIGLWMMVQPLLAMEGRDTTSEDAQYISTMIHWPQPGTQVGVGVYVMDYSIYNTSSEALKIGLRYEFGTQSTDLGPINLQPGENRMSLILKFGFPDVGMNVRLLLAPTASTTGEILTGSGAETYVVVGELACEGRTNQADCEANGCYWWSDGTCHSTPEPGQNVAEVSSIIIR